jgi:hypothetical protein
MIEIQPLYNIIKNSLNQTELAWLDNAVVLLKNNSDGVNQLLDLSVVVKRQINSKIESTEAALEHCDNDEIVRLFLLLSLFKQQPDLHNKATLKQYYQAGDSAEKAALLKGLSLLDGRGEAVYLAINAARCNSVDEYRALALLNDYPADHFAELNFNQLVLKTLFMGLNISQINKLQQRLNINLSNMCFSYAIEQALAERIPPSSLWLAVNYEQLNDENKQEFSHYVKHFYHNNESHRLLLSKLIQENKFPEIIL